MSFTESIVEKATLSWLGEPDYALLHGQDIALGEAARERPRKEFRGTLNNILGHG